ncbi:hypothetical protein [Pararhizobium haloflavum]|uniref:hypothetical protein n=1 Tax=Pararhizobium haloflavum TaxID=2037914 RepID=UPI000C199EC8|nr:hypothetical protein [Pararhizobium haloflavum]
MAQNEHITEDGEIIETTGTALMQDAGTVSVLAKAEIDTQISTARQYPRSISRAMNNILSLATLDEQTAEECIYALKRGGKPIRGPSIRLAEIIVTQFGNNRSGAQVVDIDRTNKLIVAEGFFHDLESNSATKATVSRRISDRQGRIFNDDMIAVTGNAACSIAKRNAILAGVPRGIWRRALEAAEQLIRGDAKTLVESRDAVMKAFAHFNLSPEQVCQIMNVNGADDLDLDDLVTLRAIYRSLKNGEQTVEELLRSKTAASDHKVVENPLGDKPKGEKAKEEEPADQKSTDKATDAKKEPEGKKASDKPADEAGEKERAEADGQEAQSSAQDEADADQLAQEEVDAAYLKGEEAREKGMTPKAMPKEYAAASKKRLADAWTAGFKGWDMPEAEGEGDE